MDYRDVNDPAITVSFPIYDDKDGAAFVAWTTTPWTLPSNVALCVNPEFDYVKHAGLSCLSLSLPPSFYRIVTGSCGHCRVKLSDGSIYVVSHERLFELPGTQHKKSKVSMVSYVLLLDSSPMPHVCPWLPSAADNGHRED